MKLGATGILLSFACGAFVYHFIVMPPTRELIIEKEAELISARKSLKSKNAEIKSLSKNISEKYDPVSGKLLERHATYLRETEKKTLLPNHKDWTSRRLKKTFAMSKDLKKQGSSRP